MRQGPLTLDYQALLDYLESVKLGMTNSDGTAIGDAIATAAGHLKESKASSKAIILLTDGRSNTGTISDPVLAAKAAASFGIKIYTVGTAGKGPAKTPIQTPFGVQYVMQEEDLDEGTLMAVAKETGGEFFRATNYGELQQIYSRIDALEKTQFESATNLLYSDRYRPLVIWALVLLLLEMLFSKIIFVRLP
jgi:Ca-activated chloride channel family protein